MGKLLNIIPVSDLRQDAAKVLKRVRDSKEPLVITQRGQRPQPNTHRRDAESAEKTISYAKILKEFQETTR